MRIAAIGRTEILYNTILKLIELGHEIVCIVTSKEAPEYAVKASDFEKLAIKLNCPFLNTSKINEAEKWLKQFQPMDLSVSINYTGIIQQSIIDLFEIGVLNAHGGDLPKYRGNACVAWALINGEERIGLCIHKMIGGELDSGDIIARDYYLSNIDTKITEVFTWMNNRTVDLFIEAVNNLMGNPEFFIEKQSKDPKDSLRVYPRLPEDGLIDWKNDAKSILRLINASNKPFSGAFTYYENKKMIIWEAQLYIDNEVYQAIPGQVIAINPDSIDVATFDGKLRLLQIEIEDYVCCPNQVIKSIRKRLTN
jgi:methionyl-tRNA formyltransferase